MTPKRFSFVLSGLLLVFLPVLLVLDATGLPASSSREVSRDSDSKVFQVRVGKILYTCGGPVRGLYVPGRLNKEGDFNSSSKVVALYKKKLKTARGKTRRRLLKALATEQKYLKSGIPVCKAGPPKKGEPTPVESVTPNPEATSTPVGSPTATPTGQITAAPTPTSAVNPTATPTIPADNTCDSQRRTSGFGIPSGMVGYGQNGASLWSANCFTCHGTTGKLNKTYSQIYGARNVSYMSGVSSLLSNTQNSADITADRNCP